MLKKFKKILFVFLCTIAIFGTSLSVMANTAGEKHAITITGAGKGHTYEAYQVFKGNVDKDTSMIGDIAWGNGVDESTLLTALQASQKQTTSGQTIGELFTSCKTPYDVAEKISELANDEESVKELAQIIGQNLTSEKTDMTVSGSDYTATLESGYYFIKDKDDTNNVASTRYILDLTKDQTINVKGDTPTISTGSSSEEGGSYVNAYDFQIADKIFMEMEGTLPKYEFYKDYSSYKYIFHVTLPTGITYESDSYDVSLYIDGVKDALDLKSNFQYQVDGSGFTIGCDNLKAIAGLEDKIKTANKVQIKVTYKVATNQDVSFTNSISTKLEYSNNPNRNQESKTTTTPVNTTTLYTYTLKIKSVNGKNDSALNKVGYKLIREVNGARKYAIISENKITGWADSEELGTEVFTNETGELTIFGLDATTYILKETTTLDGYNTMPETTFTIKSSFGLDGLETFTIQVGESEDNGEKTTGVVNLKITNTQGSLLPSTGGFGTILFYVIGIILFILAFILIIILIKRKKEEESK